jgi:hypothetical protein
MSWTYETRSRWADKTAFFGFFIAVLLIAHFLVLRQSAIMLSEPIKLEFADLSACMPTGNGWQSGTGWTYQENAFALDSFYNPGAGRVTAIVSCRYLLAAVKTTSDKLFKERAAEMGRSRIAKTGQIEIGKGDNPVYAGSAALNWAHIESLSDSRGTGMLFDVFFGTAELPNGRQLDVEVYQATGDTDMAEEIFNFVVGSIKFTDNLMSEAGGKIVTEIKNKGLDTFLGSIDNKKKLEQENLFLIKDATGRSIGFTTDVLGTIEPGRFGAVSFYYIRGRLDQEQVTSFRSENNLDEFDWKSETIGPSGRSITEIVLNKNGLMTVRELGPRAKEKSYQASPAAIPDVLGEFIFAQMIDSNEREIFVDIIETDGKIVPALVSRVDADRQSSAYVFNVRLLDGRGFSEQVYLDSQKRVSRRLLQQENTYTLERADAEDILREFPERGSYILHRKGRILEQNQLLENSGR